MLYSAYDQQCGCYFNTGRNSKSKEDCIYDILDHLTEGERKDDLDEDFLKCFDVEIHEHEEEIEEYNFN